MVSVTIFRARCRCLGSVKPGLLGREKAWYILTYTNYTGAVVISNKYAKFKRHNHCRQPDCSPDCSQENVRNTKIHVNRVSRKRDLYICVCSSGRETYQVIDVYVRANRFRLRALTAHLTRDTISWCVISAGSFFKPYFTQTSPFLSNKLHA